MISSPSAGSQLAQIAEYVETLAKDPRSPVFVPLTEIYRKMGLLDDAYQVASSGVRHLPEFAPGHVVLGRVQSQCGDLSAAMGSFARALDLDADNLPALKGLAKAKHQSGDAAAARQLLEKAATLAPDDEALRQFLKRIAPEEKASEPIAPAPSSQPSVRSSRRGHRTSADPFTTVTIAEIYIRQGFLRRALKIYRDLLASDPSDENIRQRLIALKQQIVEQAEQEQQDIDLAEEKGAEAAIDRGDEEPESPQTLAAEAPAVDEVAPASSESFTTPSEEGGEPLAVLTRWLDAIRQRRAHV